MEDRKTADITQMAKVIEITEQIARDAHCGYPSPRMMATDLYEASYRKQEWISVDERLPKESDWYLVNIINHFGLDYVTFTDYTKGYGFGIPNVTHWMPLPEPPKMKGGAE